MYDPSPADAALCESQSIECPTVSLHYDFWYRADASEAISRISVARSEGNAHSGSQTSMDASRRIVHHGLAQNSSR
jgi:hypothetical protein